MTSEVLSILKKDEFWLIALNRPEKRNALSVALVEKLIDTICHATHLKIPLIVLRGNGVNFSAGFDFSTFENESDGDLLRRFVRIQELLELMEKFPGLTAGFAHGRNFGAGVDLFASCKLRYCAEDTKFSLPGLRFNLVLGSRRFTELVGVSNANDILNNSRVFDAKEGASIGFANSICAPVDWEAKILDLANSSRMINPTARNLLNGALGLSHFDTDMAYLVRSASQPGLKCRIRSYLNSSK